MIYSFKVEAFNEKQAILKDQKGELLSWPKDKLPADLLLGQEVFFHVHPSKDLIKDEKKLAEEILKEILGA